MTRVQTCALPLYPERAEPPLRSPIRGAPAVSLPVIFGVLPTVAAFLPMVIAPGVMGFNDLYLILGGKQLEVEDETLEISNDASKAQMTTAFKKFNKGKLENRRLLSRFVGMVAA